MIDIHSHILPGIDDGSTNIEMSLEMLKMAEEKGTRVMVATPHFISGRYENHYDEVFALYQELKLIAKAAGIKVQILLGQEVMLDSYSLKLCKEKILRGINGSKYMLIEFPMDVMPKDTLDLIYELRLLGINPIIAHPERYKYIYETPTVINDFIEEGCAFQINTGSLEGLFGKKVQDCARLLVQEGLTNFIASDAHSVSRRCPGLKEGFREALAIDGKIEEKISKNLELLIFNKNLQINMEKIKKKKGIFDLFKY